MVNKQQEKRKFPLSFMVIVLLWLANTSIVLAEETETLTLDGNYQDNESYASIHGNYQGVDFFSTIILEKENNKKKVKQMLLMEQQNTIFMTTREYREPEYVKWQQKIWNVNEETPPL